MESKETNFYVVDESVGKVLFFADEKQLVEYMNFNIGTPVSSRDITPEDLNLS